MKTNVIVSQMRCYTAKNKPAKKRRSAIQVFKDTFGFNDKSSKPKGGASNIDTISEKVLTKETEDDEKMLKNEQLKVEKEMKSIEDEKEKTKK